jgi:hypothetical protein
MRWFILVKLCDAEGLAAARSIRLTQAIARESSATLGASRFNHVVANSSVPQSSFASIQAACSSGVDPHG